MILLLVQLLVLLILFTENYTDGMEALEVGIDGPRASGEVFEIFQMKKSPTKHVNTKSILRKGMVLN